MSSSFSEEKMVRKISGMYINQGCGMWMTTFRFFSIVSILQEKQICIKFDQ